MSKILEQAKTALDKSLDKAEEAVLSNWKKFIVNNPVEVTKKGSDTSGNFGHAGRPGMVGGSAPSNSGMMNALQSWFKEKTFGEAYVTDFVDVNRRCYGFIIGDKAIYMAPNINAGVIHGQWAEAVGGMPKLFEEGGVRFTYRPDREWGVLDVEFNWPLEDSTSDAIAAFLHSHKDMVREVEMDAHKTQDILGVSHRYGSYSVDDFLDMIVTRELKQLPIGDAAKTALISARIGVFQDEVTALTERMYTGELSLGSWEEQMKSLIRGLHSSTAAIGKGGWDNMTQSDWGKLGAPLRAQYRYLHGFAQDVADNKDTLSLGVAQRRARMYGDAAGFTAMMTHAGYMQQYLPWMPRDGTTECLVGCKCSWEKQSDSVVKKVRTVAYKWTLHPAEHCIDCIEREDYTVTIDIPSSVQAPQSIGGY